MTIPLKRIDVRSVVWPVPGSGVIKASMLASADEARDIVARARLDSDRLLEEAQRRADEALGEQQAALERQMWRQAADYAKSVGGDWDRSLVALEAQLTELLGTALRRLVEQVPAEERVRACVRQLVSQADAPDAGVLLVTREDHASLSALEGTLPWPVQCSSELAAGQVRLKSKHGRWECDFDGALQRLLEVLEAHDQEQKEINDV
jgi:vacuolar-type H+-ATPase subunit E/Vma4